MCTFFANDNVHRLKRYASPRILVPTLCTSFQVVTCLEFRLILSYFPFFFSFDNIVKNNRHAIYIPIAELPNTSTQVHFTFE